MRNKTSLFVSPVFILTFIVIFSLIILFLLGEFSLSILQEILSNFLIFARDLFTNAEKNLLENSPRILVLVIFLIVSIFTGVLFVVLKRYVEALVNFLIINGTSLLLIYQTYSNLLFFFGVILPFLLLIVWGIFKVINLFFDDQLNNNFKNTLEKITSNWKDEENRQFILNVDANYHALIQHLESRYRKMSESIKLALTKMIENERMILSDVETQLIRLNDKRDEVLELKDEIQRYKEGYIFSITKKYFKSLYSMKISLLNLDNEIDMKKEIEQRFENFFQNFSLITTKYLVGQKISKDLNGRIEWEIVGEIETDEEAKDSSIHQVVSQGIILEDGDVKKVIEEAKIIIYSFKGEKTNG
jgi:hypothetical protein